MSSDLVLLFASTAALPLVFMSSFPALRVFFGIWVVLFAPGYALSAVLPGSIHDQRGVTRIALSFGLSIATVPLMALAIHLSPYLLQRETVLVSLVFWLLFWASVALWLRVTRGSSRDEYDVARTATLPGSGHRSESSGVTYFVIAMLLGITIGLFLLPGWASQNDTSEFYMLGAASEARDFPRQVEVDQPIEVTIGIVNGEDVTRTYRVEIWAGDLYGSSASERIARTGPILMDPDQTHQQSVIWTMPEMGRDKLVTITLTHEEDDNPVRTLQLSLNVVAPDS